VCVCVGKSVSPANVYVSCYYILYYTDPCASASLLSWSVYMNEFRCVAIVRGGTDGAVKECRESGERRYVGGPEGGNGKEG